MIERRGYLLLVDLVDLFAQFELTNKIDQLELAIDRLTFTA